MTHLENLQEELRVARNDLEFYSRHELWETTKHFENKIAMLTEKILLL